VSLESGTPWVSVSREEANACTRIRVLQYMGGAAVFCARVGVMRGLGLRPAQHYCCGGPRTNRKRNLYPAYMGAYSVRMRTVGGLFCGLSSQWLWLWRCRVASGFAARRSWRKARRGQRPCRLRPGSASVARGRSGRSEEGSGARFSEERCPGLFTVRSRRVGGGFTSPGCWRRGEV
jgi:hypothetical protein